MIIFIIARVPFMIQLPSILSLTQSNDNKQQCLLATTKGEFSICVVFCPKTACPTKSRK